MIELKPCPFCGGAGEMHPSCFGHFTYEAFVCCSECGCKSPSSHYDAKIFMPENIVKAAENWNNRPSERANAQMLDALETADALIHRLLMGADYAAKEVEEIRAAIAAAKGGKYEQNAKNR